VLKLAQNSIIKEEHALKCNFNYSFEQYKQTLICVPSYPSDKEINVLKLSNAVPWENSFLLFYDEQLALK
jgi:hypothetical protein